jgi:surfactin synthase thioesterase subunit
VVAANEDVWLPARLNANRPTARLVILPHAGSGAAAWFRWSEHIPAWVEVRVARLPGRESRLHERPLTSFDEALARLAGALAALPALPTVLFGHSLGALFAFELCHKLSGLIDALCVSGSRAPGRACECPSLSGLPDDALARAVQARWGGIPDEILSAPDLQGCFLPALRADLSLVETWSPFARDPLTQGLLVVSGDDDPEIGTEDVSAWRAVTGGACNHLRHPGGHMAVLSDASVRRRVSAACVEHLIR